MPIPSLELKITGPPEDQHRLTLWGCLLILAVGSVLLLVCPMMLLFWLLSQLSASSVSIQSAAFPLVIVLGQYLIGVVLIRYALRWFTNGRITTTKIAGSILALTLVSLTLAWAAALLGIWPIALVIAYAVFGIGLVLGVVLIVVGLALTPPSADD